MIRIKTNNGWVSVPLLTVSGIAPTTPEAGDFWLHSGTQELSLYANGIWEPTVYKTELADSAGALTVNAGYF